MKIFCADQKGSTKDWKSEEKKFNKVKVCKQRSGIFLEIIITFQLTPMRFNLDNTMRRNTNTYYKS